MRATLIEIDQGAPEERWYSRHPGLRLWAYQFRYYGNAGELIVAWRVLTHQPIPGIDNDGSLWVGNEHAWTVREGDVELSLVEITP